MSIESTVNRVAALFAVSRMGEHSGTHMSRLAYEKLGKRIREVRKVRQQTMQEVARALKISISTLGNVELGHTPPSVRLIVALAEQLGVPTATFFEEEVAESLDRSAMFVQSFSGKLSTEDWIIIEAVAKRLLQLQGTQ